MRRLSISSAFAFGLAALSASAALAGGPHGTRTREERELVAARDQLASQAAQTKGAASAQYDLERRKVDNLIDDLKSGRRVSPNEVDDAIEESRSTPW